MRPCSTALLILASVAVASAQTGASATQTLTLTVTPMAAFAVSGDPQPLTISTADAGATQMSVEERSTRFSMSTNTSGRRIAVSLNASMPAGTRLLIRLADGTGTSAGPVDLSNALAPVTAVSGLRPGVALDQSIAYTFQADASADPFPTQSRTIVFTITD